MEEVHPRTTLLSLPEEIWYENIFPQLEFSQILCLRRACKPIKRFVDAFIRNHFQSNEREINENDFKFGDFIRVNLSTTAIYIKNSGPEIFEDPDVPEFLKLFSAKITHLRVRHFSTCISEGELKFFMALSGLVSLELELINITERQLLHTFGRAKLPSENTEFPASFKNLKTLKVNHITGSDFLYQGYIWDLITFCENLDYVKQPKNKLNDSLLTGPYKGPFCCVIDLIKRRHDQYPDQPNLSFYDLEHEKFDTTNLRLPQERFQYLQQYLVLVKLCYEHGVKLLNVSNELYKGTWWILRASPDKFTVPLVSLVNISRDVFVNELPNLEKLVIERSSDYFIQEHAWLYNGHGEPKWPNLEILDIHVNSDARAQLAGRFLDGLLRSQSLFHFLFHEKQRDKLKELSIRWERRTHFDDFLPSPNFQSIVTSCSGIRKLLLANWLGSHDISQFWEGLPQLEDVVLEKCMHLGDNAFIGRNGEESSFLKLKKLRRLTLNGLDFMPNITDNAFRLVFRHLKIKQFYLQSDDPLQSISTVGIASLLSGDFNKYVKTFPFEGWSLNGVSEEQFDRLKFEFRANA